MGSCRGESAFFENRVKMVGEGFSRNAVLPGREHNFLTIEDGKIHLMMMKMKMKRENL